jgi:hypothetical protein
MTQIASAHIRKRDQHGLAAAALDSLLIYQAEPIKCSMSRFNLPPPSAPTHTLLGDYHGSRVLRS